MLNDADIHNNNLNISGNWMNRAQATILMASRKINIALEYILFKCSLTALKEK